MKPQQRFAVFVKSLGAWALITGLGAFPIATFQLRQFSDAEDFFYMIMNSIAEPLFMCLAGFWLIRSDWIADNTYPQSGVTNSFADQFPDQEAASLELFSAIAKTLGVFFIVHALSIIPSSVSYYHDWPRSLFLFECITIFINPMVSGVLLLIATNWFIRLGFSELVGDNDTAEIAKSTFKTPQQALFAVIVKSLGIWFIVLGLRKFPHAITQVFAGGAPNSWVGVTAAAGIFALPVMSIVMGGLCFFATDLFVKLAFTKRANMA